jgi:hypothetical protein
MVSAIVQSLETSAGRVFRAGVVTQTIETGRWLIIDEFNRADIDQAFGELFSVLSGQTVVLPHRRSEFAPPLALVPYGLEPPAETEAICIPKLWRIIATMNTSDRGLLFTLSRALMRRFAFVNVSTPDDHVYRELLQGPGRVIAELLPLRDLQDQSAVCSANASCSRCAESPIFVVPTRQGRAKTGGCGETVPDGGAGCARGDRLPGDPGLRRLGRCDAQRVQPVGPVQLRHCLRCNRGSATKARGAVGPHRDSHRDVGHRRRAVWVVGHDDVRLSA